MNYLEYVKNSTSESRGKVTDHKLYKLLDKIENIQIFVSHHVFAVWDFMSLIKALQIKLTCVELPWKIVGSANTRYLVNEIVIGEEADVDMDGNRLSHFELYTSAMNKLESDVSWITKTLKYINMGNSVQHSLSMVDGLPESIKQFVEFTFHCIQNESIHVVAAIFTFGREDLIPNMFVPILEKLEKAYPQKVSVLKYYFERHIEVDGGHHSQLALAMLSELCGDDIKKWEEVIKFTNLAFELRAKLWDGIVQHIESSHVL